LDVVSDVFDSLLGQERAVNALRHYAQHPVHAYLFTGPAGSGIHEALVAFSAALQCSDAGCGDCESCRLALGGADSDVTFIERTGVLWNVEEFKEAERISRRVPLGRSHQIVIIENVELTAGSVGKLLKILEEPPRRTIFLLSAESLPETLATVVSRCIEVPFSPLSDEVISNYLVQQGFAMMAARAAAAASGGDLRRAQVLVRDAELALRIATWQSVPENLDAINAHNAALALEISAMVDEAMKPLLALQAEELERLTANAKAMGRRSLPGRKEIEVRFRREQRRFRLDDVCFGLSALTHVYRERMVDGLEALDDGDRRSRSIVTGAVASIELIDLASRSLRANVDEQLVLTNLLLSLARS
jgi:DNA polymerase-3 subunit delta'